MIQHINSAQQSFNLSQKYLWESDQINLFYSEVDCDVLKPLTGVPSSDKYKQLHVKVSKDLNKVDSACVVPKNHKHCPKN